jgi:hypothetical protein
MSDMMMEEVLGIEAKKLLLKCLKLIEDSVAAKGAFLLNCFLKKLLAAPNTTGEHSGGGTTTLLLLALSVPFSHYNGISRKHVTFQRG